MEWDNNNRVMMVVVMMIVRQEKVTDLGSMETAGGSNAELVDMMS